MRQRVDTAEERLARLLELQSLLATVSREIGPALELGPVLHTVLDAMRSLVAFRGGSIGLLDEAGDVFTAAADPPADQAPAPHPDGSVLTVPLVCLGREIGVMQVESPEPDAFDEEDLLVLQGLAAQVAGAIESARRHEQVVELERLKSDFIGRASHELRTPLTIVSGFTETLMGLWPELEDEQRTQILQRMQNATQRLQRLVDELLTVAGYEAAVISPHPVELPLREVLEHVQADALHPERVTVDCVPNLRIVADPKLLTHALRLLVDNALKYAGDAQLVAAVEMETGDTLIDVVDHGPGIPPVLRDRVFERFTRGDANNPGMGLGLPLVRMLAGGCRARVDLLHPPHGGAVFRLRFPLD